MLPSALIKLWKKSNGGVPHLDSNIFQRLNDLSEHFYDSRKQVRMWGLVDEKFCYRNENFLHCFNFGTISVKYPWHAEVVNFDKRMPITVTKAGTVRLKKSYRTLIHQIETPFLAFGYTGDATLEDYVQQGSILVEAGSGVAGSEWEIVLTENVGTAKSGILFYFLQKRVGFEIVEEFRKPLPGESYGLPHLRIRLSASMILEPGWPVMLLIENQRVWGVVVS